MYISMPGEGGLKTPRKSTTAGQHIELFL